MHNWEHNDNKINILIWKNQIKYIIVYVTDLSIIDIKIIKANVGLIEIREGLEGKEKKGRLNCVIDSFLIFGFRKYIGFDRKKDLIEKGKGLEGKFLHKKFLFPFDVLVICTSLIAN